MKLSEGTSLEIIARFEVLKHLSVMYVEGKATRDQLTYSGVFSLDLDDSETIESTGNLEFFDNLFNDGEFSFDTSSTAILNKKFCTLKTNAKNSPHTTS